MTGTTTANCSASSASDSSWSAWTTRRLLTPSGRSSSNSSDGICNTVLAKYPMPISTRSARVSSLPVGNASRRCPASTGNSASSAIPIV